MPNSSSENANTNSKTSCDLRNFRRSSLKVRKKEKSKKIQAAELLIIRKKLCAWWFLACQCNLYLAESLRALTSVRSKQVLVTGLP